MPNDDLKHRLDELFTTPSEPDRPAPAPGSATPPSTPAAPPSGLVDCAVLLNSIRSPILALDASLTILFCNEAYAALAGRPVAALAGQNLLALFPSFQSTRIYQAYQQVLAAGQTSDAEGLFGERHLRVRVYPAPWGLVSIAEDIPQPVAAAPEPLPGDHFLESIVENIPHMIFVKDAEALRFVRFNRAGEELLGYTRRDLIGKNDYDFFPKEEADFFTAKDREVLANRELVDIPEEPIDTAHQGRRILHTKKIPILDADGRPRYLLGISEDITERKQMEEEFIRRIQQVDTLNQVSQSLNAVSSQPEILDLMYVIIGQTLDNRNLTIALYDRAMDRLAFPVYVRDGEREALRTRPLGNGVADHVIRTRTPLLPFDVQAELTELGIDYIGQPARSLLAVPMVAGAQVTGAIVVQDFERQGAYESAHVELLVAIASQAATALENSRLLADVERRALQLQTAAAVSHAASSLLNLDELLPITAELIRNRFDLYYVGIFLLDEESKFAVLRAGTGAAGRSMRARGHKLAVGGESMIGWCVANQKARIALDVGQEAVRFDNPALPDTRSELALPLISRNQVLGAMSVQSDREAAFGETDIAVLQTMADQVANAIANARQIVQIQQRVAELATLNQISQQLARLAGPSEIVELLYKMVGQVLDNRNFYVALLDEAKKLIQFPIYTQEDERRDVATRPLGNGLTEYVLRTRKPILFPRNVTEELHKLGIEVIGRTAQCWMGVPMLAGDKAVGVIALQDYEKESVYTRDQMELLSTIAAQAATALENARLFNQTQLRVAELATINSINRAISTQLDLQSLIRLVVDKVREIFGVPNAYLALYDRSADIIRIPYMLEGDRAVSVDPFPFGEGLTSSIIRQREPLLIQEDAERRLSELGAKVIGDPARSFLGVPIFVGDEVVGVMAVQDTEREGQFSNDQARLLSTIAPSVGIAIQNARLFEEARTRAEELAVLNQVGQALATRLDIGQVLDETYNGLARLIDATNFYIGLYDPERNEVSFPINVTKSVVDREITAITADQGLTGYIIRTRSSLLLQKDVRSWLEKTGMDPVGEIPASWLGVPLMLGSQVLGVMAVQDYQQPYAYGEHDQELMVAFASQAAIAIQNARLFEQVQARARREQILREITTRVRASTDPDAIVRTAVRELGEALGRSTFVRLGSADQLAPAAPGNGGRSGSSSPSGETT